MPLHASAPAPGGLMRPAPCAMDPCGRTLGALCSAPPGGPGVSVGSSAGAVHHHAAQAAAAAAAGYFRGTAAAAAAARVGPFNFKDMVREVPETPAGAAAAAAVASGAKLSVMAPAEARGAAGGGVGAKPVRTYNQGRWQKEEHQRFLEGLSRYGRNENNKYGVKCAKQIAELIGSRSVVQVRTHAQKYFQKMEKGRGGCFVGASQRAIKRQIPPCGGATRTGVASSEQEMDEATKVTHERLNDMGKLLASVAVKGDASPGSTSPLPASTASSPQSFSFSETSPDSSTLAAGVPGAVPCGAAMLAATGGPSPPHGLPGAAAGAVRGGAVQGNIKIASAEGGASDSMHLQDEATTATLRRSASEASAMHVEPLPALQAPFKHPPATPLAPMLIPPAAKTLAVAGMPMPGAARSMGIPGRAPTSWTATAVAMVENRMQFGHVGPKALGPNDVYTDGKISQQLFTALHLQHVAEAARKYHATQSEAHAREAAALARQASHHAAKTASAWAMDQERKEVATAKTAVKASRPKAKPRRRAKPEAAAAVLRKPLPKAAPVPKASTTYVQPKARVEGARRAASQKPKASPRLAAVKGAADVKAAPTLPGSPMTNGATGDDFGAVYEWDQLSLGAPLPLLSETWDAGIVAPLNTQPNACPSPALQSTEQAWSDSDDFGWFTGDAMSTGFPSPKVDPEAGFDVLLMSSGGDEMPMQEELMSMPMPMPMSMQEEEGAPLSFNLEAEELLTLQHVARQVQASAEASALYNVQVQQKHYA